MQGGGDSRAGSVGRDGVLRDVVEVCSRLPRLENCQAQRSKVGRTALSGWTVVFQRYDYFSFGASFCNISKRLWNFT